MPIGEGEVDAELAKLQVVWGKVKVVEEFLRAVKKALADQDPLWAQIDPTNAQKQTLLAYYDTIKADLKTAVANF